MNAENLIFGCKCIGAIGTLILAWELFRICTMLDHPRLRSIAWKVFIFFGIVGCLKMVSAMLDTFLLENPYIGTITNTIVVYWLVYFIYKKRKQLAEANLSTDSRTRISSSMLEIADSMKVAQLRIKNELNS